MSALTKTSQSAAKLISLVALTMLLMAQGYLLEHEMEHALSDHEDSCLVCQLAASKGDALVEVETVIDVIDDAPFWNSPTYAAEKNHQHYFSPRAPPAPASLT